MFLNKRVTAVTQATPDYSANDVCGGELQFQMRTPEGAGQLQSLVIRSKDSFSGVAAKLILFDSEPSASTTTENGALAIHANDLVKVLCSIAIAAADWVDLTGVGGGYIVEKTLTKNFKFAAGERTIWGIFVPGNTLNLSAVDSLEFQLGAEVD